MDVPELTSTFVPTFETLFLGVKGTDTDEFLKYNHPIGWLMTVVQKAEVNDKLIEETLAEALTRLDTLSLNVAVLNVAVLHAHAMVYLSHLLIGKVQIQKRII